MERQIVKNPNATDKPNRYREQYFYNSLLYKANRHNKYYPVSLYTSSYNNNPISPEKIPRFIGISIDQNEKLWVKKLKKDGMPAHIQEVLADPYVVGDAWDITSIPRFLLIDENFRIINAFAPRPSDREKIEPLLAR